MYEDIKIGDKFNKLEVVKEPKLVLRYGKYVSKIRCKCECGKLVFCLTERLVSGQTKSCNSEIVFDDWGHGKTFFDVLREQREKREAV